MLYQSFILMMRKLYKDLEGIGVNIINGKFKMFVAIFILILGIINGCAVEEVQYDFPLSSEDIEEVLLSEDLKWKITESDSFGEGHKVYRLEKDNDKIISFISSYGNKNMKSLQLSFFPKNPMVSKSISEPITEDEWADMIKLAGRLYGNSRLYKNTHEELIRYTSKRSSNEYGDTSFTKRIDDIHLRIVLRASKETNNKYDLAAIFLMNDVAYESTLADSANYRKRRWLREETEVLENHKIFEILQMNDEGSNKEKGLIIQGHLEKIKKAKKEEMPKSNILNLLTPLYEEDYLSAILVDESGSLEIIMPSNSLNKEELSQVRNHYITYIPDENIFVIHFSVLSEQLRELEKMNRI